MKLGKERAKRFNQWAITLALGAVCTIAEPARGQLFIQKFTSTDGMAGDFFGYSVAISGDTAVVGALTDDDACVPPDSNCNSGSAYVFIRSGPLWIQMAKLTASDAEAGDGFGRSVGVSGDTIVVGATGDDDGGSSSGSGYIFVKPAGGWTDMTETAKLTASDASPADSFGWSVSISGDTALVGAYFDDDAGESSGSAYVFVEPVGGWASMPAMTETAKLTASDAQTVDEFGYSVSISGDTVLIGAHRDDDACAPGTIICESGSAYVFVKPAAGWVNMTETAKLTASDAAPGDDFGVSVSISGDTAIVGARNDDDAGNASGSAYVFEMPAGGWADMTETAKLIPSDSATGDQFGVAVGIDGDTAVVGASTDDDACPADPNCNSGSAYFFHRPAGGWTATPETGKLIAPDAASLGFLGSSIAMNGDTAIAGTSGPTVFFSNFGAYVFRSDRDGDGVADNDDGCPDDSGKIEPGPCGCGMTESDSDGDGIFDCNDNCPMTANADQADGDGDGVGDACEESPAPPAVLPTDDCGCGNGMDGMMAAMILPLVMTGRRRRRRNRVPNAGRGS